MLTGVLVTAAVVWAIAAVFTFICVRRAPEGFEDETGFHLVKAPARTPDSFDRVVEVEAGHTFG
ncbi:MAG: hypothetical protein ACREIA_07845 [Opitutaceae bacterium]